MTMTFLQMGWLIFICTLISCAISVAISVSTLSTNQFVLIGFIDVPLHESIFYGASIGILHGLITGTIIYQRGLTSIFGIIGVSIVATEIFLILAFIIFFVNRFSTHPGPSGNPPPMPLALIVFGWVFTIGFYYGIFTVILAIPSIVIGAVDAMFLNVIYKR